MMTLLLSFCVHFFSGSVPKVPRACFCYRKDVLQIMPYSFWLKILQSFSE